MVRPMVRHKFVYSQIQDDAKSNGCDDGWGDDQSNAKSAKGNSGRHRFNCMTWPHCKCNTCTTTKPKTGGEMATSAVNHSSPETCTGTCLEHDPDNKTQTKEESKGCGYG